MLERLMKMISLLRIGINLLSNRSLFYILFSMKSVTMNRQQTVAILAVVVAATAAFALAPLVTSSAMAAKGGVNPGGSTTCVHNGNGDTSDGACSNPSGTTQTCVKVHGKFECSTG
jgi:hypothetical protein